MLKTRLTLPAGANGTKKLRERYGDRLVCVRYRYDAEKRRRMKTVELIEEELAWVPAAAVYLVKIPYEDVELRQKVKEAGGQWNPQRKAWHLNGSTVRRLRLEDRVVAWFEFS